MVKDSCEADKKLFFFNGILEHLEGERTTEILQLQVNTIDFPSPLEFYKLH